MENVECKTEGGGKQVMVVTNIYSQTKAKTQVEGRMEERHERGKGTRGKACSRKVERRRHPEGVAKYTYYVQHGRRL